MSLFPIGLIASGLAGIATFIGALPVLAIRNPSSRVITAMTGFGGGIMLAATAFSLIIPGTEAAIAQGYAKPFAALIMVVGIVVGAWCIELIHGLFPHEHFLKGVDGNCDNKRSRIWLFITAITLHNFPEGMAVGVSFGSGNVNGGIATALGIGLQNMPEGLVVALSLVAQNYRVVYALWISLLTGLVEPIGGLFGVGVVSVAQGILPWAMGFTAGAMLFVICDEILPESQKAGIERDGTIGTILGFVVMMFLDIALS